MDRTRVEVHDPLLGTVLGRRFRVDEKVAAGGFGSIYRATHLTSNYEVALKLLQEDKLGDDKAVARFRREAQTLTTLRSPHTVTTYELVEEPDGTLFMVMELLRGETLYSVFKREGALPWRRVAEIARAVCESLAEAHALGVVHRDLKPENIVIEPKDGGEIVKVLDFGIAKVLAGSEIEHDEELTNHNEVIGTWDYVSPEQIRGEQYSGRSDIYTLGVVMYELVTGVRPFAHAAGAALMAAIFTSTPLSPSARMRGVPPELDRVLLKCLEPEPANRFADVADLAGELDAILERPQDDQGTKPVVLGPDDEATHFVKSPPKPVMSLETPSGGARLPYATPLGMPIVPPPMFEPAMDSAPTTFRAPTAPPQQQPQPWATAQVRAIPARDAYSEAMERDRVVRKIVYAAIAAIVVGVLLALVV